MRKTLAAPLTALVLTFGGAGMAYAAPAQAPGTLAQDNTVTEEHEDSDKTGLWGLLGLLGLGGLAGLARRKDNRPVDNPGTYPRQPGV
ncbi:WGxxGxxG family protein [Nocardia sp. NPDC050697]|uniref:WGxxGxxG family protein n=1 Tax=Nocardia sp. NPDC050697 TaxID=3155158 RepID=UPI0033E951B5